jgi:hypothetical protein
MIEVNEMMRESAAGQGQRMGCKRSCSVLCSSNGEGSAAHVQGAVPCWSGKA